MTRRALRWPLPFGFHILVRAEPSSFAVTSLQAQKVHQPGLGPLELGAKTDLFYF